jgi:predicted branched-subunit amino acid permease
MQTIPPPTGIPSTVPTGDEAPSPLAVPSVSAPRTSPLPHPAQPEESRREALRGAREVLPAALSVLTYGLVLGVLAAGKGVPLPELILMNGLLFSGSAQFILVGLWGSGLPAWQMALAAVSVNLRYPLLSASIAPVLEPLSPLRKALGIHILADEGWAVSLAAHRRGEGGPAHYAGASVCVFFTWMIGTVCGALFGNLLGDPRLYGLDFAFTAVFTALAVSFWRGREDLLPWGAAGATALLAERFLPGAWYILIGGVAGALAAGTAPREISR